MAHHLDLLRTIHLPVTSDGRNVKNSFGVIIATASDDITAHAIAEMINMAEPAARAKNEAYEEQQRGLAAMLSQSGGGHGPN